MKTHSKNRKGMRGFTLIELIIVIALLGIFAGLSVPAISGLLARAEQRTHEENAVRLTRLYETWVARGGTATLGAGDTGDPASSRMSGFIGHMRKTPGDVTTTTGGSGLFSFNDNVESASQVRWLGSPDEYETAVDSDNPLEMDTNGVVTVD